MVGDHPQGNVRLLILAVGARRRSRLMCFMMFWTVSTSKRLSTPCMMQARRSRPMPVSMFGMLQRGVVAVRRRNQTGRTPGSRTPHSGRSRSRRRRSGLPQPYFSPAVKVDLGAGAAGAGADAPRSYPPCPGGPCGSGSTPTSLVQISKASSSSSIDGDPELVHRAAPAPG